MEQHLVFSIGLEIIQFAYSFKTEPLLVSKLINGTTVASYLRYHHAHKPYQHLETLEYLQYSFMLTKLNNNVIIGALFYGNFLFLFIKEH